MTIVRVSHVTMVMANAVDRATGVVGYVHATINGLVIDGITVRRSLASELVLAFPKRRDRFGLTHTVVRPEDDDVRREITRQILAALGLGPAAVIAAAAQGESP